MRYVVRLQATGGGDYVAACDQPQAVGRGLSPANALDGLRAELRFQLEMCPCSGIDDDYIEIDIAP